MKISEAETGSARRGRPFKITRERLVEVASELGLEDFKLSEVARRLNVTLQTLYNHVRDREELLHLAAEVLEVQVATPADDGLAWDEWWRRSAHGLLDIYRRTPGLAPILMARPLVNAPPLTEQWETAQIVAEREGFSPVKALWANMAVHEFVYAWAAREYQRQKAGGAAREEVRVDADFAAQLPHFSNAVEEASKLRFNERFEMNLDALLAGLQQFKQ